MRHSATALALALTVVAPLVAQETAKPKTVGGCPAEPAAFHACALDPLTRTGKTETTPRTL